MPKIDYSDYVTFAASDLKGVKKVADAVQKAGLAIFKLHVTDGPLDSFVAMRERLGNGFDAFVDGLQPAQATKLVDRLDKGYGKVTGTRAVARIKELASGAAPTPVVLVADIKTVDQLRDAKSTLGDGFVTWLAAQPDPKRKLLLTRVDPDVPGLKTIKPDGCTARLTALAEGEAPVSKVDINLTDLRGLRAARDGMGEALFETWLNTCKPGDRKKAMERIDRHKKDLKKATPAVIVAYLRDLAEGGALSQEEGTALEVGTDIVL